MGYRKIIFRADSGPNIGMGHFIRTLAIAEMLKDDFYCVYATQSPNQYQIEEIEKICHSYIFLPPNDTHFKTFLNLLEGNEIVVLDNYFFNTEYQIAIKEKGCKLVCIDDLHDKVFVSDLIINHSPYITPNHYKAQIYTKFALGLEYIMIRSEFLNQTKKKRIVSKIDTVLICFGGSDPMNIIQSVIQEVIKFKKVNKIFVLTGGSENAKSVLSELANSDDRIEHLHSLNQHQLLDFLLKIDLAIVSSSGILFELMTIGTTSIAGYFTKDQEEASNNLSLLNLIYNLGNLFEDFSERLFNLIDKITIEEAQLIVNNQKKLFKNSKTNYIKIFKELV